MTKLLNWKRDRTPLHGEKSLFGDPAKFQRGLYEITEGVYAWMQPNGSWGESNAAMISSGGESLVFNSLFDLKLTANMLRHMEPITKNAPIRMLVNSHSNGDHTYGNELFKDATILASEKAAEEMPSEPASAATLLPVMGKAISCCGLGGMPMWPLRNMHRVGKYFQNMMLPYHHKGITLTLPTETFTGHYKGQIGSIPFELIEVGPAHTDGDIMLYLPDQKVLFAGDILFVEGLPAAWNPGLPHWPKVLEQIQAMDIETIIPGHGPIITKDGVDDVKSFFDVLLSKTEDLYKNGMKPTAIARHLLLEDRDFKPYLLWDCPERTVMATNTYTRVLDGNTKHYSGGDKVKVLYGTASLAYDLPQAEPKLLHVLR